MKFLCGSCRTKYQISDDKVRGKILTIRCKKCGAKVMVKESLQKQSSIAIAPLADEDAKPEVAVKSSVMTGGSAASAAARSAASASLASAFEVAMGGALDDMPTSIAPTPANEADAGVEWYVAIDGAQSGPYAYAELVRKLQNREVVGRHYCWHDGFDNWKRIRDVADLVPYLPPDPKKKPPPPPPTPQEAGPEGGKVVDFAQKRAERDRKGSSTGAPEGGASDGGIEAPTAKAVPIHTKGSDRLEQLDHVLNEALGIQGEGKTTRADAAEAKAAQAVVQGRAITNDAFSEESSSDSFIPENLFDQVPRASTQEVVAREATRFFVAAAGVNAQKSKNKVGLFAGIGAAVLVLAFIGLWAAGVINISLPGIGNPFASSKVSDEYAVTEKELTEEEKKQLEAALAKGTRKKDALAQISKKRKGKAARPKGPGLPGDYVDDAPEERAAGTRGGGDAQRVTIGDDELSGRSAPMKTETELNLPNADVSQVQPADMEKLDAATIRRVIQDGRTAVSSCYAQQLRADQDLKGKLEFLVTVQPTGEVSRATVSTAAFKGTALGQCIADKIKDWRFPAFRGEPQQIVVPFVLERASY